MPESDEAGLEREHCGGLDLIEPCGGYEAVSVRTDSVSPTVNLLHNGATNWVSKRRGAAK